ncbi:DUF4190 domain-containing protein [Putridiphycobacter roseus]|uniref:DUF4190 domain-containing protein n=1 Tax=Putridiphycobacter roseus TaxID=2219161 RepID=A0A2W1N581_9FLAO|nr:CCC motif membrane protein [Putridiphycobacter roseus]PZE18964.1 DUF4190 domain-containing protein [Putridiphycobacter roseus]
MDELDSIDSLESQSNAPKALPNATAVLVLGILSIVTCIAYGVVGLILGIIALVLSKKDKEMYLTNPTAYEVSYKNSKAGKVCAIIGVSLSALFFIYLIGVILFLASNATYYNSFLR